MSPDVGEIDTDAVADLASGDPDHALSLLAEMASATDREMADLAARLAGRLVLDLARAGSAESRGIGRLVVDRSDRAEGDLDLERSLDAIVAARAEGRDPSADELAVRQWSQPATAIALVIDRSGSMGGRRLATAAVATAACAHRAPVDWSAIAFSDQIVAVKSLDSDRPTVDVVDDVLRLRGYGTTDLAGALAAARDQLSRSTARRQVTILLSDCRATTGVDPIAVARRLDDLCVIAPADDADDARWFATAVGAPFATVDGPNAIPAAIATVLT